MTHRPIEINLENICFNHRIDGLVLTHWSYAFLALTHQYGTHLRLYPYLLALYWEENPITWLTHWSISSVVGGGELDEWSMSPTVEDVGLEDSISPSVEVGDVEEWFIPPSVVVGDVEEWFIPPSVVVGDVEEWFIPPSVVGLKLPMYEPVICIASISHQLLATVRSCSIRTALL